MSDDATAQPPRSPAPDGGTEALDRLIERLEAAAGQLRSGEIDADVAATLVEQCASTAAQASAELERLVRVAGQDSDSSQDRLL